MGKICVLLNGAIRNDARVVRTVRSLSRDHAVHLYYTDGAPGDADLFSPAVKLANTARPHRRRGLVRRCLDLHREYDFLAEAALAAPDAWDLVFANDYPCLAPSARIADARGARLVYDSHEIYLETVNQFFPADVALPKRTAFRLLTALARRRGRRVESRLVGKADLLVTTNPGYAEHFRRIYRAEAVEVVRNCPPLGDYPASDRIREELRLREEVRILLYQGILNPGRGLEELVLAAREFEGSTVLVLIGDGMLLPGLRRTVEREGLGDRVFFPGFKPHEELLDYTASADVGTLILDPINLSKRLASANKIFDYMACRLPVLATDGPEHRRVIGESDAGILLPDRRPESIAAAVNRLMEEPVERARLGANGRKAFEEQFHWEAQEAILLRAVNLLMVAGGGEGRG